jgi:hypothetical protein
MFLKTKTIEVPGQWIYTQPETKHTMKGTTFRDLCAKVATHRNNMRIPTTARLSDEIEAAICARLSPEDQHEYCKDGMPERRSISWREVDQFLRTMVAWGLSGEPPVPQEEAERRASICEKCPMNVGTHGCGTCRVAMDAMREKLLKRGTSHDSSLQACGVCGCDNKLQVHVPLDTLQGASNQRFVYPDFCWKAKRAE